ncbi:GNAT family N-acetyltransferase, partial [Serratia marcescens]
MHNDGRFDYHNALRYSSDELAKILSHCFENYIVRFVLDGPTFAARFGAEDLSLNDSLIVTHRHEPVAVALIARRGRHSRVAAFSVRPEMRGQGLGKALMQRLVADARQRGDRRLSLEVIEGNEAALALYHRAGLRIVRTLTGHQAPAEAPPGTTAGLQAVDPLTVSHRLTAEGATDLPWLIAPESLFKLPGKPQAYTLNRQAYAVVMPGAEHCWLHLIYVPPQHRGQGHARALLAALQTR